LASVGCESNRRDDPTNGENWTPVVFGLMTRNELLEV
jgi:hypothetical protein